MDSIRKQIEDSLQRPKINKETVYGILKQIVDVIEPPKAPEPAPEPAPAPPKAPAPAPSPPKAPEPTPAPAPPKVPEPAPAPATPEKKTVKRVVKKKVAEPKE